MLEIREQRLDWQKEQRARKGTEHNSYVYVHIKNDNNDPFYVGIGWTHTRPWDYEQRSEWHKKTVKKHGVRTEIIADGLTLETAKFWEKAWIKSLKENHYVLVNVTEGGDANPMEIDEIRHKQRSNVLRGDEHPSKKPEVREKVRQANIGKKYSAETNAKKSRKKTNEQKEHLSRVFTGRTHSNEAKSKMSSSAHERNRQEGYWDSVKAGLASYYDNANPKDLSSRASKGWETRRKKLAAKNKD